MSKINLCFNRYNIYNKKSLNSLNLPWTTATLQLAVGLLYVLPAWALGLRKVILAYIQCILPFKIKRNTHLQMDYLKYGGSLSLSFFLSLAIHIILLYIICIKYLFFNAHLRLHELKYHVLVRLLSQAPKVTWENIKTLIPIALMHATAHITAVISLNAGAVSFTHIVKAAEPAFTSLFAALFLKQYFAAPVYLSLIPVMAGVGIASLKERSFRWVDGINVCSIML